MKFRIPALLFFLVITVLVRAQEVDTLLLERNYDLKEYRIPMRDGAELFTVVYTPKDTSQDYPFLMNRTCYNASKYTDYQYSGYPSEYLVNDGYILVFQDVRGRYMSDGTFDNMRPIIPGNDPKNKKDIIGLLWKRIG